MRKSKLWVFGHSFSLPFNIVNSDLGWPNLLSQRLDFELHNWAEPGADNLYIYHTYLENLDQISSNDLVIIGWSHYSRKCFVLDENNDYQNEFLNDSMIYDRSKCTFIRSKKSVVNKTPSYWLNVTPITRGLTYYDDWFIKYFNEYEQTINFQSYLDSVQLTCPTTYIPFFFSKESTKNISVRIQHAGYLAEFILENQFMISEYDGHMNETGHGCWSDHLFKLIK
jgi:hypothetical protein